MLFCQVIVVELLRVRIVGKSVEFSGNCLVYASILHVINLATMVVSVEAFPYMFLYVRFGFLQGF